jgi:hypothetical protein
LGFWVTPFELRVRNSFFGGDLCSRSRFNKVLQKDLSSDLRGAAVSEQFGSGDKGGFVRS